MVQRTTGQTKLALWVRERVAELAAEARIKKQIPHYQENVHGPDLVELIGLEVIRSQCPLFPRMA